MYAIDFGTSNTVIARWNAETQSPETIVLPGLSMQQKGNPPLVPSLLYVEQAAMAVENVKTMVGMAVRDRGLDLSSDPRFFRNFKRGIGTPVQGFIPELDGHILSFEAVGNWFLRSVIEALKQQDPALDSIIFTVPVDSFESYRNWLGSVCQSLDIDQVRLIDEPTAAALGYQTSPEQKTLLVVDFGGGTLDLSLIQPTFAKEKPTGFFLKWGNQSRSPQADTQPSPKTVRVLAKAGENLGGADIDRWLAEHFASTQALPLTPLTLRLVEKLKIALSTSQTAEEAYFDEETLDSYELSLTRDRLEEILTEKGFFDRLDSRLDQVLQQAQRRNLVADDIDAVLLVGGSAQIPAVQAWAAGHFGVDKFGVDKIKGDRPFEAVAQGALRLQTVELEDFLHHSYGIRYWDRRQNAHGWHPIIQRGQPYPTPEPIEFFLGASTEKQPSIELILGELGESAPLRTEVYFEGNQLVTRQTTAGGETPAVQALNDTDSGRKIAQLTPPGFPGSDRIRVLFNVDTERFLRMTVEDLLTSETLLDNQVVVQLS
ncbi:Hsp70 family protein [cf. Phormidesmis sp. LEGE 11477]|uniref:Hsp70 family protein n=1 Tax=cf. Phormidesmis sp. LEGE 11477 TaxID=1828680 RepID=UPI001D135010|nr:Hsp70 family protein [cf. Phormidesmis sp. LEGE 11477]